MQVHTDRNGDGTTKPLKQLTPARLIEFEKDHQEVNVGVGAVVSSGDGTEE